MLQTKKIALFIRRCYFNWLGGIIVKCVTYLHGIYRQPLLPVLHSLRPRARGVIRQNCVRPGNKSAGSNWDTQCSWQAKACKVMKEKKLHNNNNHYFFSPGNYILLERRAEGFTICHHSFINKRWLTVPLTFFTNNLFFLFYNPT